jgi:hypothetical protein
MTNTGLLTVSTIKEVMVEIAKFLKMELFENLGKLELENSSSWILTDIVFVRVVNAGFISIIWICQVMKNVSIVDQCLNVGKHAKIVLNIFVFLAMMGSKLMCNILLFSLCIKCIFFKTLLSMVTLDVFSI